MLKTDRAKISYTTDRAAVAFLFLALSYLLIGLLFGSIGSLQYLLPGFLKEKLSFQKTRPLHVYLVIAWIFTAAQGCIYYFLPRLAKRNMAFPKMVWLHWISQWIISVIITCCFFMGEFGGREYLEFPPWLGGCIILSWVPFALNFFATLRSDYRKAPVYIWSWTAGIIFFFITLSESYLWLIDYFNNNIIRDITVQWKALGSMVGSWNMLVYGCSLFVMERLSGDRFSARKSLPFFFFFLGFTNLLFNWGHHTYIVPAAPWIKTVSYVISMSELLILAKIIFNWRKTLSQAQKNFHHLPYRLMAFADLWILLNLGLALLLSIPSINYFTHGTHITVAHAMGATIGINTMILLSVIFYIVQEARPVISSGVRRMAIRGISISNIALIFFWVSLLGSGMIKSYGLANHTAFANILNQCLPFFRLFAVSGGFILLGLGLITLSLFLALRKRNLITQGVTNVQEELNAFSEA